MSKSRGFTIVELVVVIIIMGILLVLGVVNVTKSQANARDAERDADTGAIAKGLETRYNRGNPVVTASYVESGSYPSVNEILHAEGKNPDPGNLPNTGTVYLVSLFPGTSTTTFYPPNTLASADVATTFKVICSTSCSTPNAEDATQITNALGGSTSVYVYEPITATNQVCITGPSLCVRYNLYYLKETVAGTQTKASLRQ